MPTRMGRQRQPDGRRLDCGSDAEMRVPGITAICSILSAELRDRATTLVASLLFGARGHIQGLHHLLPKRSSASV